MNEDSEVKKRDDIGKVWQRSVNHNYKRVGR